MESSPRGIPMAKRQNRQYGTMKNMKFLKIQADNNVFEFFEIHAVDEKGKRRSRGKILELLIASVGGRFEEFVPRSKAHKVS